MGQVCGCLAGANGKRRVADLYEPLLGDSEREAVSNLLQYLESRNESAANFTEALNALNTLSYSSNLELQRSAALTFAEITEKDSSPVSAEFVEPILHLLQSTDTEVQRAASGALGNLAMNERNKVLIVELNGLDHLARLLLSSNVEVQSNACGCVTNLAILDENKIRITNSAVLPRLIKLAVSPDLRVQRNAAGALLNLTHTEQNRPVLVQQGALAVLSRMLASQIDTEVQYYCAAAVSNLAVDAEHRRLIATSHVDIVDGLVGLLHSPAIKVQLQATLALRNLATDEVFQLEAVERGALAPLLRLLSSPNIHVILAATAALRNISIHPRTEARLVQAGFLQPLIFLMSIDRAPGRPQFVVPTKADGASADAQARMLLDIRCHAVSCLRNMVASEASKAALVSLGGIERLVSLLPDAPPALQSEMAACLAVLALSEMVRDQITKTSAVGILIGLVTSSESVDVQGNCAAALGNMAASMAACQQFTQRWPEAASYLQALVTSNNPTFIYIAVWTLYHLAKHKDALHALQGTPGLVQAIAATTSHADVDIAKLATKAQGLLTAAAAASTS